jgi:hypothetical protein
MRRAPAAFGLGLLLVPAAVAVGIAPYVLGLVLEGLVAGEPMVLDAAWRFVLRAPLDQGIPALPVVAVLVPAMRMAGLPRWACMALAALAGAGATMTVARLTLDASLGSALWSVYLGFVVMPTVALAGAAGALLFDLAWRRWRPECSST